MALLAIEMIKLISSAGFMAALSLILAVIIVFLSSKFYVEPDQREQKIRDILSGANCGACGYPGCDGFAKAITLGKANPVRCPFIKENQKQEIQQVLSSGGQQIAQGSSESAEH